MRGIKTNGDLGNGKLKTKVNLGNDEHQNKGCYLTLTIKSKVRSDCKKKDKKR